MLLCCSSRELRASGSVKACFVVLAETNQASSDVSDTRRIQAALNLCTPGRAVVLKENRGKAAFVSAPLILPRGVTLFVDNGVTLFASTNPRDYDLYPGSCAAGPNASVPDCKPFLYAYQAAFSAVKGGGIVDGKGDIRALVSSYESQGFALEGITLSNAAGVHAAIFKTTGFRMSNVRITSRMDGPDSDGLLLSNAVKARIDNVSIQVPGHPLVLKPSILGPNSDISFHGLQVFGGAGMELGRAHNLKFEGTLIDDTRQALPTAASAPAPDTGDLPHFGPLRSLTVAQDGAPGVFSSIQKALDALPVTGGEITVKPGTYREVITVRKPNVHLHGESNDPAKTIIVFNNGPKNGGTFNSATAFVETDNVVLDHLTISNDLGPNRGQAVALSVTGDRDVFRNLRILGAQDTLFAASRYCYSDYGPCVPARQYFVDSYIEGGVDFIFGDSKAVFERCELHGIASGNVMYTAQSKHTADQDSGYVFDHCKLTGEARTGGVIALGRAWRPYATVVFLETDIEAPVTPAGWSDWPRFGKSTLPTAYFAEYDSRGPGANPNSREAFSHQLSAIEAAHWSPARFLAGTDGWQPENQK